MCLCVCLLGNLTRVTAVQLEHPTYASSPVQQCQLRPCPSSGAAPCWVSLTASIVARPAVSSSLQRRRHQLASRGHGTPLITPVTADVSRQDVYPTGLFRDVYNDINDIKAVIFKVLNKCIVVSTQVQADSAVS